MTNTIEFTVDIAPMGAVRTTRRGKFVNKYAIKYRDYKQVIALAARKAMAKHQWQKIEQGVAVEADITAIFKVPKSYTKKKRERCLKQIEMHLKKPDVDNIFKGVTDACNGICYDDDKQIPIMRTIKKYGEYDQLVVKFTPMEALDT